MTTGLRRGGHLLRGRVSALGLVQPWVGLASCRTVTFRGLLYSAPGGQGLLLRLERDTLCHGRGFQGQGSWSGANLSALVPSRCCPRRPWPLPGSLGSGVAPSSGPGQGSWWLWSPAGHLGWAPSVPRAPAPARPVPLLQQGAEGSRTRSQGCCTGSGGQLSHIGVQGQTQGWGPSWRPPAG